jgi:hypothetical protein
MSDVARPGSGQLELRQPQLDEAATEGAATVVAPDAGPATSHVAGLRELRRGLRAPAVDAASLGAIEQQLRSDGARLTPGDVLVMELPRAELDEGESRPRLRVTGSQVVRAVAIDRAGDVMSEEGGEELAFEVPVGAWRLALAGVGNPFQDPTFVPSGVSGWHAGMLIAQIAADTYLVPGAVLRTTSPETLRGTEPVTAAMVRAADAVRGRGVVSTRFPLPFASVVVAVESATAVDELLAERGVRVVEYAGWSAIDEVERAAGEKSGRPRVKLCSWDELLAAAEGVATESG